MSANVIGKLKRSRRPRARAAIALLPGVFALMLVGVSGAAAAGPTLAGADRDPLSDALRLVVPSPPRRLPDADPATHRTPTSSPTPTPSPTAEPDGRWEQRGRSDADPDADPDGHPNQHSSSHRDPGADADIQARDHRRIGRQPLDGRRFQRRRFRRHCGRWRRHACPGRKLILRRSRRSPAR